MKLEVRDLSFWYEEKGRQTDIKSVQPECGQQ